MRHRRTFLIVTISSILAIIMVLMGFMPQVVQAHIVDQQQTQGAVSNSSQKGIAFDLQTLLDATVDLTDTDGDGLPDSVEWVLGTDPENPDSDFDTLDDYYEAANGLDPLKADSNSDGLVDNLEIKDVALDFDNDGIPNVWDDDNDNDGVRDGLDPTPFAKSITGSSFHFDVKNNGKPTYIDFQIKPANIEHLKLPGTYFDWPADTEGQMQDRDNSVDDVEISPALELTVNTRPPQSSVEGYQIVIPEDDVVPENSSNFTINNMTIGDIEGGSEPELLLVGTNNEAYPYKYIIGWDMQDTLTKIMPARWSSDKKASQVTATLANMKNGNDKPDLLMFEDPDETTEFTYWVGFDIDAYGEPTPWYNTQWFPMFIFNTSYQHKAGGIAVANVNRNSNPKDVVLMGIGTQTNDFGYMIAWDVWVGYDSSANTLRIVDNGRTGIKRSPPIGYTVDRGSVAVADINGNGIPDLLLMGVISGTNELVYMVGWDLDYATGDPASWSEARKSPSIGTAAAGTACTAYDLNNNGQLDLVLMGIDNVGLRRYHYIIGWDIDTNGNPASWSQIQKQVDTNEVTIQNITIGDFNQNGKPDLLALGTNNMLYPYRYIVGWDMETPDAALQPVRWSPDKESTSGVSGAIADVNGNNKSDLLMLDDSDYDTGFYYWTGFDIDTHGEPIIYHNTQWWRFTTITSYLHKPGGIAVADIDKNGKKDVVMMGIGTQTNDLGYMIAWDYTAPSQSNSWQVQHSRLTGPYISPTIGYPISNASITVADINNNGTSDLLLMGIISGTNEMVYVIGWDLDSNGNPASWSDVRKSPSISVAAAGSSCTAYDLNNNGKLDLILMGFDDVALHKFHYAVGWDIGMDGNPTSWNPIHKETGTSRSDKIYVPLTPVVDYGNNIALSGRMFYPAGTPLEISIDVQLVWMVNGKTDNADGTTQTINLARYKEDFMLTGFTVTENYGSDAGIFYSQNKDQTIAAGFVLAYDYLRSQTPLTDVPAQITNRGLSDGSHVMNSQISSFPHQDAALLAITSQMVPAALNSLAPGKIIPVHIALEDDFTSIGMDKIVPTDGGKTYTVDLRAEPVVTSKMFKMNWYDTTSKKVVESGLLTEIEHWGLEPEVFSRISKLMAAWSAGDVTVSRIGSAETQFEMPEAPLVMATLQTVFDRGLTGIDIIRASYGIYRYFNAIHPVGESFWKSSVNACKYIQAVRTGQLAGLNAAVRCVNFASNVLALAVAFYGLYDIASSSGWSTTGSLQASYYFSMTVAYAVALEIIASVPYVGWFLALGVVISDLVGGWFGDMVKDIWDHISYTYIRSAPIIEMDSASIGFDDYDDNGLDVGDRLDFFVNLIAGKYITVYGNQQDLSESQCEVELKSSMSNISDQDTDKDFIGETLSYTSETLMHSNRMWAEPNTPMINFPWKIQVDYSLRIYSTRWVAGIEYRESTTRSATADLVTIYLDVLPGNLANFLAWNAISPLDTDGDGLWTNSGKDPNTDKYDTDGDGLSDGFEIRASLNPSIADTDGDGLTDGLELRLGTDPKIADTDGDGLSDGEEYQGWEINFTCYGQLFSAHVSSDPLIVDTDGDGVSDYDECQGGLWDCYKGNPRSQDTNGDGVKDRLNIIPVIQGIPPIVSVFEGSALNLTGSFVDPDPDTWTATVDYDLDDAPGSQPLALNPDKTFSLSRTFPITPWVNNKRLVSEQGHVYWRYTIKISISDDKGGMRTLELPVKYDNFIPVVDAGPDATISVGSNFTRTCSWTDPGQNDWTVFEALVDYGDGSGRQNLTYVPGAVDIINKTIYLSHIYSTIGTYTMTVTYMDEYNEAGSDSAVITVNKGETPPTPDREVGGEIYPVDRITLLVPWVVMIIIFMIGMAILIWRRRIQN